MERGASSTRTMWFLRKQALWQIPLYGYGDTLHLGSPSRLAGIAYKTGRWLTLTASSNRRWVTVDDGWGYQHDHPSGLWLVETHPRGVVRRLFHTADPTFAPDSRQLAMTRIESTGKQSVAILDLVTKRWHTLVPEAKQPFWSADGRELALIKEGDTGTGVEYGMVVDARSGQIRYQTDGVVSLTFPLLSPDGRYFADVCAISRPQQGHTIYDRQTGKALDRSLDWPNRLPTALYGWSPNSKWLACNWRVENPKNDGIGMRDEVGLVSWKPGVCRWIDVGNQATFSKDSQNLFWLRPNGILCATTVGSKTAPIQKLLTAVEGFAIQ